MEMRERLIDFIRINAITTRQCVSFDPVLGDPEALTLSGQLMGAMVHMDSFWASPKRIDLFAGSVYWSPLVFSAGLAWHLPMLAVDQEQILGAVPVKPSNAAMVSGYAQLQRTVDFIEDLQSIYEIYVPRMVVLVDMEEGDTDAIRDTLRSMGVEIRFLFTMTEILKG